MAKVLEPSKTKIARRVIEVFEFFDEQNPTATVMDIVRRYGRPQSSTSELLASLVELGLLYKDSYSRAYFPTPRMATLSSSAQPAMIRSGRLFAFMDQLAQSTHCSVALFGIVGTHVQVFRSAPASPVATRPLGSGTSECLSDTAVGLLLLSTMPPEQARSLLWRLNAEAPEDRRISLLELVELVATCRRQGHATGKAGFDTDALVTATLLPRREDERPLALGLFHAQHAAIDVDALLATMKRGIERSATDERSEDNPWSDNTAISLVRAV